jgi:hypothetical protein
LTNKLKDVKQAALPHDNFVLFTRKRKAIMLEKRNVPRAHGAYQHESPHGGWTETLAKAGFAAMLLVSFASWAFMRSKPQPEPNAKSDSAVIKESNAAAAAFAAKGAEWGTDDLVSVRNSLVRIRDREDGHSDKWTGFCGKPSVPGST